MVFINNKTKLLLRCEKHGYFKTLDLNHGDTLGSECLGVNLLLFVVSGELDITYNEFISETLHCDTVAHFSKSGHFCCIAKQKTTVVIFTYSIPRTICDRSSIEDLKPLLNGNQNTFPSITVEYFVILFIKDIIRYAQSNGFEKFSQLHDIKEKELFILFRTQIKKEKLAKLFQEIISDSFIFKNLVLQHYAHVKNINELSSLCGYTTKTFSRIFSQHFHTTPYKWLQKQKSRLIPAYINSKPSDSLIVISENFGFSSLSHFNSFCRKHYGLSAKNFREKILIESDPGSEI